MVDAQNGGEVDLQNELRIREGDAARAPWMVCRFAFIHVHSRLNEPAVLLGLTIDSVQKRNALKQSG